MAGVYTTEGLAFERPPAETARHFFLARPGQNEPNCINTADPERAPLCSWIKQNLRR
jgi:hypothetical protein